MHTKGWVVNKLGVSLKQKTDLMENNITEIINNVQRHGIVESHYHYETDTITIKHEIASDKQTFYLLETDFKYTLTLILPEKHNNKYFRYIIDYFKFTNKLMAIGLTENFRGDYIEEILDNSNVAYIYTLMSSFINSIQLNIQTKKKVEHGLKLSIIKILNTDMVYKENIASYSKYENSGAFISIKSSTNKNILERLSKFPVSLDWIDTTNITEYGFNTKNELLEYLIDTDFYKKTEKNLVENFAYSPILYINPDRSNFTFSCKAI